MSWSPAVPGTPLTPCIPDNTRLRTGSIHALPRRPEFEEVTKTASSEGQSQLSDRIVATCCVLGGCILNTYVLEAIIHQPGGSSAGQLLTFCQFLFIAVKGLTTATVHSPGQGFALRPRAIPLKWIVILMSLFWCTNVSNNMVFAYNVSVPVHTVFRAGQLATSMILGALLFSKTYSKRRIFAVACISVGVMVITLATKSEASTYSEEGYQTWLVGVFLMLVTVILSSCTGLVQEKACASAAPPPADGPQPMAQWRELMFYTHAGGLPIFLIFYQDIIQHFFLFLTTPKMLMMLALNSLTQYICIRGVYQLAQCTDALTLTIAITCRKLLSLVLSVIIFDSPFTTYHLIASALVFGGTVIYSTGGTPKEKQE